MNTTTSGDVISGLEGVLACESAITYIDGPNGVLQYRGYDIHDFAETASFESVVYLLWTGDWPTDAQLAEFRRDLAGRRAVPGYVVDLLRQLPATAHPMSALRTAVSALGAFDPHEGEPGPEADRRKAANLVAQLATIVALQCRLARGQAPVEPDPTLGHAENYLYMLTGARPEPGAVQALDAALVIYADHELNASTFTGRVVAGTLSDLYSAIVAAIGALKGPLHGGAIDDAMRLFQEIGAVENVRPYVDAALAAKRKIPGFGHRVYRTLDPRAVHLKEMARRLAEATGETRWFAVATATQEYLLEKKRLNANVDYYAALVLYHLGFPLSLFTNFVASSRIAGWCAHLLEQYANNRLIRPRAKYVGELNRSR